MELTTQDIKELEKQLDSEIAFPNTWTHDMITKFGVKLLVAIYLKLQESRSEQEENTDPSRPDPKDFYVDGRFDRGAYTKALNKWKEDPR
jgi:hypothetical protein